MDLKNILSVTVTMFIIGACGGSSGGGGGNGGGGGGGVSPEANKAVYGTWYTSYEGQGQGENAPTYTGETLLTVEENGTLTFTRMFSDTKQKQVEKYQVGITGDTITTKSKISVTTCGDASGDPAPVKYKFENDDLILVYGEGSDYFSKATPEQIKKFSDKAEGCE